MILSKGFGTSKAIFSGKSLKNRTRHTIFQSKKSFSTCLAFKSTGKWTDEPISDLEGFKFKPDLQLSKVPVLPIVFCHGFLGFDKMGPLSYWRGIQQDLEAAGIKTMITKVSPTQSIKERAKELDKILREQVQEMKKQNEEALESMQEDGQINVDGGGKKHEIKKEGTVSKSERLGLGGQPNPSSGGEERPSPIPKKVVNKFHLIGHSMAGLDCRYLISQLGGHEYTFSLTSVGTPHRGSSAANYTLEKWGKRLGLLRALEIFGIPTDAWLQLTTDYLENDFNPKVLNHPDVKYFSISAGGDNAVSIYSPMRLLYQKVLEKDGPNDGLVSIRSAKWGQHLGTVEMDHLELVNWSLDKDALYLYRNLMELLAEKEKEAGIQ
eukprot:TRINITY_DN5675_c0_g1_i1.p1 TRINITY_DN5675_c0_g1~~TRINITY_DN5675_c0_g1_i1.p1  ORF type:complete len:380 (+),score=126.57 TRINITY_DN5675_c0_g1_i1:49-1188(+)